MADGVETPEQLEARLKKKMRADLGVDKEEEKLAKEEIEAAKAKKKELEEEQRLAKEEAKAAKAKEAVLEEEKNLGSTGSYPSNTHSYLTSDVSSASFSMTHLAVFLLFIIHLYDALGGGGFNREGSEAIAWLSVYAAVAAFATLMYVFKKKNNLLSKETLVKFATYLVVSTIAYIFPVLLEQLERVVSLQQNWVFVLWLVLSSPWVLYLLFTELDGTNAQKFYVGFWVLIALFMFIGVVTDLGQVPGYGQGEFEVNPMQTLRLAWKDISETMATFGRNLLGIKTSFGSFVNRNLNDTLGRQYRGQVDPYADYDLRMGVNFEDMQVRSTSYSFKEDQPIDVWVRVSGESFREKIDLSLRCYAQDSSNNLIEGIIYAQGERNPESIQFDVLYATDVRCSFEDGLPSGIYDITIAGAYNFATWAYIQYHFAPYELINSMMEQDIDPAYEAGIDKTPTAIYNDGPAMLGIASEWDQPLAISPDDVNRLPAFGASLANRNINGEIRSVQSIVLSVPQGFVLHTCDRPGQNGDKVAPSFSVDPLTNYKDYAFPNIADIYNDFESVTCFMSFESIEDAYDLMESYDLVRKTFAAKTQYLYEIKDSLGVSVE